MPNNKQQTVKRLIDYKKYTNDLLEKNYTRGCNEIPAGKTWYIRHLAVYHPSKLGKTCVVFDCNAEYEGTSINKELLIGPDPTNQIVSILIQFREEKVAVMADVELMYNQVRVLENQQIYLKFL